MSRTTAFILIGFAAAMLMGVLSLSALLLGRGYFTVREPEVTLITPLPFPATATATVPAAATTPADEAPSVTPAADPVDSSPTAAPTTVVVAPGVTSVPPTAVTVVNTSIQYVMALTDVNMRSGPGTGYSVVGWVAEGQIASVTGVSSDFGWWRVKCADGSVGSCWVTAHAQYTQTTTAPVTACTNSAALVSDVSVPDGTQFAPNTGFNKIWRIKNTGTCTWDSSYKIVHAGGHMLGAVSTFFPLRETVFPGHTVDLTINMVSPDAPNTYQSDWKLQDSEGKFFGVGRNSGPFWVKIVVPASQPTTISGLIYQDWNQNGVYDNGETLMGSREVWLTPGTACHVRQDALAIVYSGADGRYTFSGMY
ncbi:MAG TPA: NBR1-Ig-like domain-containing protein, partial [Chloroflexota bacterium]|nr:NBR1-Ig-like domain-containing protein [Chloroflexota bacterium]